MLLVLGKHIFRVLPGVLATSVSPGRLAGLCPVFASALCAWRQHLRLSLACVCVGLISSGCVSHHSGSFTGLPAVPGIRATSPGVLGGRRSGPSRTKLGRTLSWPCSLWCPHRRYPRIGGGRWLWEMALPRLHPASQGRLQVASCCLVTFMMVE